MSVWATVVSSDRFEARKSEVDSSVHLADRHPLVSLLETNFESVRHEQALQATAERAAGVRALATALSISPLWAEMPCAVLVIRPEPDPLLGVVGYFDIAGRARLEGLRWQLENFLPRLRYVGYKQAEEDCERLAELLVERFGREELQSFRFTAIPRGGLIVLGMLAYVLGLRQSQLEPPHSPERPLVVVDDCVRTERCQVRALPGNLGEPAGGVRPSLLTSGASACHRVPRAA